MIDLFLQILSCAYVLAVQISVELAVEQRQKLSRHIKDTSPSGYMLLGRRRLANIYPFSGVPETGVGTFPNHEEQTTICLWLQSRLGSGRHLLSKSFVLLLDGPELRVLRAPRKAKGCRALDFRRVDQPI